MEENNVKWIDFLVSFNKISGGLQWVYKFPNGYGASIICHDFSYGGDEGLFEGAVLWFNEDDNYKLDYTTPITNDVVGYLDWNGVLEFLTKVYKLPPKEED